MLNFRGGGTRWTAPGSCGVDPPFTNGNQMPLHENESSSQKTLLQAWIPM